MLHRTSCPVLAGVTAGLFPLALLVSGFILSAKTPLAARVSAVESGETAAFAAPALPAHDKIHIEFARREYRDWTRDTQRLALARTSPERARLAHQAELARQGYFLCYFAVTNAGRRRAHLPSPEND